MSEVKTDIKKMYRVIENVIWTYMDGDDCWDDVCCVLIDKMIPNTISTIKKQKEELKKLKEKLNENKN